MRLQPSRATEITGMIARLNGRPVPAKPWVDGSVLPWDDRQFSELFASRVDYQAQYGFPTAAEDVDTLWTQLGLCPGARVLDLACGPGRHTIELAKRGVASVGIDIGPGAVELATQRAQEAGLECEFVLGDVLDLTYSQEFDAAFIICGQVSNFRAPQLTRLLVGVHRALVAGGTFVMEYPDAGRAEDDVKVGSSWSIWKGEWSIFGKEDHLVLQETFYDREQTAAIERYYVISPDGSMREVSTCTQYYHPQAIDFALAGAGFEGVAHQSGTKNWRRVVARKP